MKDTKVFVSINGKMESWNAEATVTYGATVSYGGAEKFYGSPLLVYGRGMSNQGPP